MMFKSFFYIPVYISNHISKTELNTSVLNKIFNFIIAEFIALLIVNLFSKTFI